MQEAIYGTEGTNLAVLGRHNERESFDEKVGGGAASIQSQRSGIKMMVPWEF